VEDLPGDRVANPLPRHNSQFTIHNSQFPIPKMR
jgi:hypothetical protein